MTVVELATRRAVIGGSDAAAACGVDPHRSRIALWLEKRGHVAREETEPMLWGSLLEPVIADVLANDGLALEAAPDEGYADPEHPWMVGHPDYLCELEGEPGVLTIATAGPWAPGWKGDDEPPTALVVQLYHYLHLTGRARGMLACLVSGQRLVRKIVVRDDAAIRLMLDLEAEFASMLHDVEPPEPDGSESAAEALRALYPEHRPGSRVRLSQRELRWYRELVQVKRQAKAVEKRESELTQRLQRVMRNRETAIAPDDRELIHWRTHERTALNTAQLRATYPSIYDEMASTTSIRRFDVR